MHRFGDVAGDTPFDLVPTGDVAVTPYGFAFANGSHLKAAVDEFAFLQPGAFTVEATVRPADLSGDIPRPIASVYDSSAGRQGARWELSLTEGRIQWDVNCPEHDRFGQTPQVVAENQEIHIAAVFDPARPDPDDLQVFVDGKPQKLSLYGSPCPTPNPAPGVPFRLAARVDAAQTTTLDAQIEDFAMYSRALSVDEIGGIADAAKLGIRKCHPLRIPYAPGEHVRFTSGPHGRSRHNLDAVDLAPKPSVGCTAESTTAVTSSVAAPAAGIVGISRGLVTIDPGDRTLVQLCHIALLPTIHDGMYVRRGEILGNPGCLPCGHEKVPPGAHVHIARAEKAGRAPLPATDLVLSDWHVEVDRDAGVDWFKRENGFERPGLLTRSGSESVRSMIGANHGVPPRDAGVLVAE